MFEKALDDWIRPNTFAGFSPSQNVNLVNLKEKKKPHNIQINNNRKEPKVKANIKYSEKQNYRRYKTKTEPKLHSKILIDEGDDIINKIREAFGEKKPNTNYAQVETAPAGSMITNVEEEPVSSTAFGTGTRPKSQRARKLQDYTVDEIWDLDTENTANLFRNANLGQSQAFRQLYEEQTRLKNRSLNDDEMTALAKIILQRNIEQEHSIDDIDPKDQEDLTGMAPGDISPSRPHGSAIVKFPEPARPSMTDFFMSARGIIPEDQLRALHGLKPKDKIKIFEFTPQEAKNFTIDEIQGHTVGELRGMLKVKHAHAIKGFIKRKETVPFKDLVEQRNLKLNAIVDEFHPFLARTRAQTEFQRQKEAASKIAAFYKKHSFGDSLSPSEMSALSTVPGASSSSPISAVVARKPVGRPPSRPSTLAKKAEAAKKLDEAVKASVKKKK